MIIPYNPAAKASPPKVVRAEPNYGDCGCAAHPRRAPDEPLMWQAVMLPMIATDAAWRNRGTQMEERRLEKEHSNRMLSLYGSKTGASTRRRQRHPPAIGTSGCRRRSWTCFGGTAWSRISRSCVWRRVGADGLCFHQRLALSTRARTQMAGRFAKRHGLPHINPHALRHTQASVLYQSTSLVTSRAGLTQPKS